MSERFRFVKLNNTKAAKLLEAFRLYGTKDGYYTVRSLWLVYALTDTCKSFYLNGHIIMWEICIIARGILWNMCSFAVKSLL